MDSPYGNVVVGFDGYLTKPIIWSEAGTDQRLPKNLLDVLVHLSKREDFSL